MIFSLLQKIEQGERALGDRELTLLLPYLDRPELKDLWDSRTLLRLGKLVEHDKEWSSAVSVRLAYDVLFGKAAGPVIDQMLLELLTKPGGTPLELCFALERAAEEGDRERLRRVTSILARLPDAEDGRTALTHAVMFDDYLALRLAAASGHCDNTRHLLNGVLNPGRGHPPVDEAAWMREENRMWTLVSVAAGESQARQDTADMLLNRAKRAGVEAEVMKPVISLLLYYAARSGDPSRLQHVWDRGRRVLGVEGLAASFMDQRGNMMTALAIDAGGQALTNLLALAERDFTPHAMSGVLQRASLCGYGSAASLGVLLESARRTGGQALVDSVLRADNYQIFRLAGVREDCEALAVLEAHSSGPFMRDMLKNGFLASFVGNASIKNIEYMAARTHALCGPQPLALMLMAVGQEPAASRGDFMSVLNALQATPCIRNSGLKLAVPLSVMKALQGRAQRQIPTHEFWQRVGGDGLRWREVTNHDVPQGVNPYSSPWQFKPKLYEELLPHVKRLIKIEGLRAATAEQITYRFAVLFANAQEAERYIETAMRRARPGAKKQPFAEASEFMIPSRGVWSVARWRNLLLKHGRPVARFILAAPLIEEYCAAKQLPLPSNPGEVMDVARFVLYRDAERNPEFARLAVEHGISDALFVRGLSVLQKGKKEDALPVVTIDGADIGKPNYYMQKLPANDPRGLILGHITNNCQSIGNNGEYAAVDGMTRPDSGFYVWKQKTKGQITDNDRIVAQSWAWLSPGRQGLQLVFDSYERLSSVYNHLARPFLEQYAYDTTTKGPLSAIFLGAGGGTPSDLGLRVAQTPAAAPPFGAARPDSARQYAVVPVNHRKPA